MHFKAGHGVSGCEGVVELSDQAAVESNHTHHAVFEALAAHTAARRHRRHGDRLVVKHEPQGVSVMHRDVEDDAATRLWPVDAPTLKMRGQVDGMEYAREQRPADAARLDRFRIARCVAALRK